MKNILILLIALITQTVWSQDDLLEELESDSSNPNTNIVAAFKGLKVVNFESTKLANKKDFYFIVAHRFGTVKNGIDDFFGLDQAVTQIKFIYGLTPWLNLGAARSSRQKKYGVHAKYRLLTQEEDGMPFTLVGYNLITINTELNEDLYKNLSFEDRLNYVTQILISHKVNDQLSLLIAPTYIHENLATRSTLQVSEDSFATFDEDNDQFALGIGGRLKITNRWSINTDYGIHLNRNSNSVFKNPFSVGVDLETGGHVFQMHFTNAQGMFEDSFLIQGEGDWSDGDFFFGFNLSRLF